MGHLKSEWDIVAMAPSILITETIDNLIRDLPTFYSTSRTVRKNTFAVPKSSHEYYSKSFVPSSIELWNNLPSEIRCLNSHKALKAKLKAKYYKKVPAYFCYGTRSLNILHTKLRIGCSDLNSDKYLIGISNTDLCDCGGGEVENARHFLLECGTNLVAKVNMLDSITDLLHDRGLDNNNLLDIDLLLYGSDLLSYNDNVRIFSLVHTFIKDSNRFQVH